MRSPSAPACATATDLSRRQRNRHHGRHARVSGILRPPTLRWSQPCTHLATGAACMACCQVIEGVKGVARTALSSRRGIGGGRKRRDAPHAVIQSARLAPAHDPSCAHRCHWCPTDSYAQFHVCPRVRRRGSPRSVGLDGLAGGPSSSRAWRRTALRRDHAATAARRLLGVIRS